MRVHVGTDTFAYRRIMMCPDILKLLASVQNV